MATFSDALTLRIEEGTVRKSGEGTREIGVRRTPLLVCVAHPTVGTDTLRCTVYLSPYYRGECRAWRWQVLGRNQDPPPLYREIDDEGAPLGTDLEHGSSFGTTILDPVNSKITIIERAHAGT